MRRAAKKDSNHNAIAAAFASAGWSVEDTSRLGNGFPDLVVARDAYNTILVEVKSKRGSLTDDQIDFRGRWKGKYLVVKSVDDVEKIVTRRRTHAVNIQ